MNIGICKRCEHMAEYVHKGDFIGPLAGKEEYRCKYWKRDLDSEMLECSEFEDIIVGSFDAEKIKEFPCADDNKGS